MHAAPLTGLEYVVVIVFMVKGVGLVIAWGDRLQDPYQLNKAGVCDWIAGHRREPTGDLIL